LKFCVYHLVVQRVEHSVMTHWRMEQVLQVLHNTSFLIGLPSVLLACSLLALTSASLLGPGLDWFAFIVLFGTNYLAHWAAVLFFYLWVGLSPAHIQLFLPSLIVGLINWHFFLPLFVLALTPLVRFNPIFSAPHEVMIFGSYMLLGELWFYSLHAACHKHKASFRLFHQHHHEITLPHALNSAYQHPVEAVLPTLGTCLIGPLLVRGHWITVMLWNGAMMWGGVFGHSGLPNIHDVHHRRPSGNFGFLFLDYIFNTQ